MNDELADEDRRAILARRRRFIALALGGLSTGCTPPAQTPEGGGTTTVGSSTTGPGESESGSGAESESESEGGLETETETGMDTEWGFVPDTGPRPCLSQCDNFAQDCPDGEKCVPYSSTGELWDANKCVPITGDKAPGEPCTSSDTVTATDDCDDSGYCWEARDVEGTPTGVCRAFCEGTPDDPLCADGRTCLMANEGSINLCIVECDPLMSDCGEGLGCMWSGGAFACMLQTEAFPTGEPCGFMNDCAPGSLCAANEALPACASAACCVDYCATDDPESCPDPELECVSFFGEGDAPEGLESVGICVAPGSCDEGDPGCLEHMPLPNVDN